MLIRARCYLGFGLSIEETAGILQSKSLEEIDDLLEEQEQIIQKNIIYQMNLLKRLRTNRKLISRSENLNFTLQKRPGIYRIDTQKCYSIDLKKEEREELKVFCQKIPFVFSTALFPKEHIENENKEFYYGIGVEEEFAGVLDIKESDYVHYYPEQLCLYMCVPSRSSQILTYEVLQPAFDYMEKNNLQLCRRCDFSSGFQCGNQKKNILIIIIFGFPSNKKSNFDLKLLFILFFVMNFLRIESSDKANICF